MLKPYSCDLLDEHGWLWLFWCVSSFAASACIWTNIKKHDALFCLGMQLRLSISSLFRNWLSFSFSGRYHINYAEDLCFNVVCAGDLIGRVCICTESVNGSVLRQLNWGCNQHHFTHRLTYSCTHTNMVYNAVFPRTGNTHHCKSSFVTGGCCWNIFPVECQWGPILCEYSCTVSKENSVHSAPSPADLWKCK